MNKSINKAPSIFDTDKNVGGKHRFQNTKEKQNYV